MSGRGVEADVYESPLVEIERAVQERAKDISLEMPARAARRSSAALIDDEVARLDDDYRGACGRSTWPTPTLVAERAFRNLAGYGPLDPLLGGRRRVGDHGQRARQHLRAPAPGPVGLPRRGLPRRRARRAHADQDPRRRHRLAPQARPRRRAAGRPARRRGPHPHRPRRRRPRRPRAGEHPASSPAWRSEPRRAGRAGHARRGRRRSSRPPCGPGCRSCSPGRPGRARPRCCRAARPSSTRPCGWWWPRRCSRPTSPLPNVAQMQTRPARADRPQSTCAGSSSGFLRMAPDVAIVGEVRDREALPELRLTSAPAPRPDSGPPPLRLRSGLGRCGLVATDRTPQRAGVSPEDVVLTT